MGRFTKESFLEELECRILPFWTTAMSDPSGGFRGRIDGHGRIVDGADKGAILNARILWTFASAFRLLGKKAYLATAERAYEEIRDRFIDKEYGGVFWSLDASGTPKDTRKQFYALAFAIYGLSEYYSATGVGDALDLAVRLYGDIEEHSLDPVNGGYIEACRRDWSPIDDMRLSAKDRNDAKTMNTHLHILEGYTCLYRAWKDPGLGKRLKEIMEIFLDRIIRPSGHLGQYFSEDWTLSSQAISYGHDIEASWLLRETAAVLGDPGLTARTEDSCRRMAVAAMEGFTRKGGMIYEYDPVTGCKENRLEWWEQAETVVGCTAQHTATGDRRWLEDAAAMWQFIQDRLISPHGEWYWGLNADGTPDTDRDIAGFWKCPYHNGRMCLEMISRL